LDGDTAKKAKIQGHDLNERIQEAQAQLDYINNIQPVLFGILLTLIVVILVYLLGSYLLGRFVHLVAILVVGVGVIATAKFSVTNK
jgi:hypothetical protein